MHATLQEEIFFSFYMLSQRGSLALPEFTQGIYKEKKKRRKRNVLHNTQLYNYWSHPAFMHPVSLMHRTPLVQDQVHTRAV